MSGIFISYRRSDAEGWAGRLYDSLKNTLAAGRVGGPKMFRDIEDIPPGVEFDTYITEAVGSCDVLLALIGPRWLEASDSGRRRLDDPHDFTRMEIATALRRDVMVIPVLVGQARMPQATDLPDDLKDLSRRQAYELTDSRWAHDSRQLAKVIRRVLFRRNRRNIVKLIVLGGFVGLVGSIIFDKGDKIFRFVVPLWPSGSSPRMTPGQLSGDWVDRRDHYIWRLSHIHDVVQIDVFTPIGRFHRKGIGGVEGRVVRFSLDDNLNGQLTLSDDGKWLRGHYHVRPSEPIDLEWRSN
jgi:hypothetical protein